MESFESEGGDLDLKLGFVKTCQLGNFSLQESKSTLRLGIFLVGPVATPTATCPRCQGHNMAEAANYAKLVALQPKIPGRSG